MRTFVVALVSFLSGFGVCKLTAKPEVRTVTPQVREVQLVDEVAAQGIATLPVVATMPNEDGSVRVVAKAVGLQRVP